MFSGLAWRPKWTLYLAAVVAGPAFALLALVLPADPVSLVSLVVGMTVGLTVGVVAIGVVATCSPDDPVARTRRANYRAVLELSGRLQRLSVWSNTHLDEPDQVHAALEVAAEHAAFLAGPKVTQRMQDLLMSADALARIIATIRHDTTPGPNGEIDKRREGEYSTALSALRRSREAFVDAARVDAGIGALELKPQSGHSDRMRHRHLPSDPEAIS